MRVRKTKQDTVRTSIASMFTLPCKGHKRPHINTSSMPLLHKPTTVADRAFRCTRTSVWNDDSFRGPLYKLCSKCLPFTMTHAVSRRRHLPIAVSTMCRSNLYILLVIKRCRRSGLAVKFHDVRCDLLKGELNVDKKWQSVDLFYIIMNEIRPRVDQF